MGGFCVGSEGGIVSELIGGGGGTETRGALIDVEEGAMGCTGTGSASLGVGGGVIATDEAGRTGTEDGCGGAELRVTGGGGGGIVAAALGCAEIGTGICVTGAARGGGTGLAAIGVAAGATLCAGGVATGRGTAGAVAGGAGMVPGRRRPQKAGAASVNCNST